MIGVFDAVIHYLLVDEKLDFCWFFSFPVCGP